MYKSGDIVEVTITNITPYGAFCKIDEVNNGLIHISEFSDFFVKNIEDYISIGDHTEVEILEYDEIKKQAKLSFKSIRPELRKNTGKSIQQAREDFDKIKEQIDM